MTAPKSPKVTGQGLSLMNFNAAKTGMPDGYRLTATQICGSPYSTSRQIVKEINSALQDETTSVSHADDSKAYHQTLQDGPCESFFKSIQQADH